MIREGEFVPRDDHFGIPLLGDLRLRGWVAALLGGYAQKLIVVGGYEEIPASDGFDLVDPFLNSGDAVSRVPRGYAICHALQHQYGVPADKLEWRLSKPNTQGNAAVIERILSADEVQGAHLVSSNHYHLPRAMMNIQDAGLEGVGCIPAEAYLLAVTERGSEGCERVKKELLGRFGPGPLSERVIAELTGVADALNGCYAHIGQPKG